jgi:hypothetical protein
VERGKIMKHEDRIKEQEKRKLNRGRKKGRNRGDTFIFSLHANPYIISLNSK